MIVQQPLNLVDSEQSSDRSIAQGEVLQQGQREFENGLLVRPVLQVGQTEQILNKMGTSYA